MNGHHRQLGPGSRGGGDPGRAGGDSEVVGLDEAKELVYKFLSDNVGLVKVETLVWQLFQQGFQAGAPFSENTFSADDDLDKIAEDIVQAAEEDISTCGSHKILYSLKLAHHNGRRNFPLTVGGGNRPDAGASDMFGMNESDMIPTARNMIAQQMQHNHALMVTSVGGYSEQIRMLLKTLEMRDKRIEFLEAERQRFLDAKEAIMSLQHERDMQAEQQKKNNFRMDQIVSTGMNAVAPLINKYAGKLLIPEKATPLEGQMIALASTLKPEQVQGLISSGLFDPAQLANFMQIFQSIHDSFEAEKKRLNGTDPGMAGANGPNS